MFTMNYPVRNMLNNKDIVNKITLIIGVLALTVTSYSVWEQVRDKSPEIKISVLVQDKVTDLGKIKGLSASYSFNGVAIKELWKFRVRLENIGDGTIIGYGSKSHLLKDAIEFGFPESYNIIDLNEIQDGVRAKVTTFEQRFFKINFEQWRSGETLDIELFLEKNEPSEVLPKVALASRSLIDGKFSLVHEDSFEVKKRKSLLNLPEPLVEVSSQFVRWSKVLLFVLLAYVMMGMPKECLVYFNWQKQFKEDFDKHIDTLFSNEEYVKMTDIVKLYKDDPLKAPDWVWESFKGEKATGIALLPKTWSTVIFFSVCWLFIIASVVSLVG